MGRRKCSLQGVTTSHLRISLERSSCNRPCHHVPVVVSLMLLFLSATSVHGTGDASLIPGKDGDRPCIPEQYLKPVRAIFQKLIPEYNPRGINIQLRTDLRVQLGPDDPNLVPFLASYYKIAIQKIETTLPKSSTNEGQLAKLAMTLYFKAEYGKFLAQIGVPLSCLSYFMGVADAHSTFKLQQLARNIQDNRVAGKDSMNWVPLLDRAMTGDELAAQLRLSKPAPFVPSDYPTGPSLMSDDAVCQEILLYLKDGSIMAKLPVLSVERSLLYVPSVAAPLYLNSTNFVVQIGRYVATGLNCLGTNDEKGNFTHKVSEWMSKMLFSQIASRPTCSRGLGGIIPFMLSLEEFERNMPTILNPGNHSGSQGQNASTIVSSSNLDNALSNRAHIHSRRRRSAEIPLKIRKQRNPKNPNNKPPSTQNNNQHQQHRQNNQQHQPRPSGPSETKNQQPHSPGQGRLGSGPLVITNINSTYHGRFEKEKVEYDKELIHLYDKLNNHFKNNHMMIERLDVVRLPEHKDFHKLGGKHPAIYFHSTTTRAPSPKKNHRKPVQITTKPTTTSTTTTTTTTTTTPRSPQYPPAHPAFSLEPVGHVRIVGEVNVDENRLAKPISVFVRGNKLNAQLKVIPKHMLRLPGEIVTFNEDPDESRNPHPNIHFGKHHHTRKHTPVRPLHPRKHLLFKQQTRDPKPHNVIDKAVQAGLTRLTSFAQSVWPGLFKRKPEPKMHAFNEISPESPNYVKTQRQRQPPQEKAPISPVEKSKMQEWKEHQNLDRGLKQLLRTDNEFPR